MSTQDLIIAALDARGARSWLNPADAAIATLVDCERLVERSYGLSDPATLRQALAEVLTLAISVPLAPPDHSPASECA